MAGASHALQRSSDGTRRTDKASQVHRADINAQFQRSGGHQDFYLARFQAALGIQPQLARETAVMRSHRIIAQDFRQMMRHPLRQSPRVYKNQR